MKRAISILIVLALGAVANASVALAEPKEPKPSVSDPAEDANFANDQGAGDGTFGDHVGPTDASSFADLISVAFTSDKKNLSVHILTQATAPPAAGEGFRVRTNPGPGGVHCLNFEIFFPGAQNDLTASAAHLRDVCAGNATVEAKATLSPFGALLIIVPRKGVAALKKGAKLTAPQAQSFLWSGSYPAGVAGPYLDTTKTGTDYTIKN
ncbi:MAG: hypothetical protein M3238_05065 [Actinomycetota bacterium]|nr:hypothetical protein [Actinomycetota bacterium]